MDSTTSCVSRRPAVSERFTRSPRSRMDSVSTSRVVPGRSVTIARSSRSSALSSEDLPTFGRPAMTTLRPSCATRPLRSSQARRSVSQSASARARRSPAASASSTSQN